MKLDSKLSIIAVLLMNCFKFTISLLLAIQIFVQPIVNEKMGEMAGEQIFELATMGVGKGAKAVRAVEEGTSALKTSLKTLGSKGDNAVSNMKRSVGDATKPFEKFSFGELRNKVRSQMDEGYTRK